MKSALSNAEQSTRLQGDALLGYVRTLAAAAVALTSAVSCAPDSHLTARAFVVQGKLDHMTCAQLASQQAASSSQIHKLEGLMQTAGTETGGGLVGAAVYGPTLAEARANRRIIEETLVNKNCDSPRKQ